MLGIRSKRQSKLRKSPHIGALNSLSLLFLFIRGTEQKKMKYGTLTRIAISHSQFSWLVNEG
ncbi:hypothetical protein ACSBR2_035195 [Camellia fascicularis]